MSLGIAHTCDVNISLQRRMNDEMDTCAFTARSVESEERARGPEPARRADDGRAHHERSPSADWPQSPQLAPYERRTTHDADATGATGFPPTWAIVLALAVALAALAYANKAR